MPVTNGVFIHDLPQADEQNNKKENIVSFGGCCSSVNPNTQDAQSDVLDSVNSRSKDSTDAALSKYKNSSLKDLLFEDNTERDKCGAYGACVFSPTGLWDAPKDNVYLSVGEGDMDKALLKRSTLMCRYNGVITIEHDRQLEF